MALTALEVFYWPRDWPASMARTEDSSWSDMLAWTYTGVDHSLTGNGGTECINFIPFKQKIIETVIFVSIGLFEILIAIPRLNLPAVTHKTNHADPLGKRILLLIMTLTFGIELGYKFATRQMIWILNPCHIVTMMQVSGVGRHFIILLTY